MTAAENSFLGFAKQSVKGTPITDDSAFMYALFTQGSVAPSNVVVPLPSEVGGGAMLRNMIKTGIMSGGAMEFVPRPQILGHILYAATGKVESEQNANMGDVLAETALTVGAQSAYTTGLSNPGEPAYATAQITTLGGSAFTGDAVIHGTSDGTTVVSDTLSLVNGAVTIGTQLFQTITSIDLPAWVTEGDKISVGFADGSYTHEFSLGADQFDAPYYTVRSSPGNLWGEQYQDCRFNALMMEFRGGGFVSGAAGIVGGLPKKVATTSWAALGKVDSGPQLVAPVSAIELPSGASASVLSGSFTAGMSIPMDQQWVVGSYSPDGFDITSRAFALSLNIKISDGALYSKIMYDPAGGSEWTADLFREADIKFELKSNQLAGIKKYHSFSVAGNGKSGSDANVVWSATPISLRAGQQIVMNVTGIFLADATQPVKLTLVNDKSSY